jgi:hypothetical protein
MDGAKQKPRFSHRERGFMFVLISQIQDGIPNAGPNLGSSGHTYLSTFFECVTQIVIPE